MAQKNKQELIDYVIALIDEVMPDSADGASQILQEAPVEKIEDQLDNSATFIIRNAPIELLAQIAKTGEFHAPVAPGNAITSRLIIDADTLVYTFVCPSDFKRFLSIKLTSWAQPIFELMDRKDARYRILSNKYTSPTWRKPQAVLIPFSKYVANEKNDLWINSGLALELFKGKTDSETIDYFEYIPDTKAENFPEELQDPIAWVCASRVLESMRKLDLAKSAMNRAISQLQFKFGTQREDFNNGNRQQ